MTEVFVLNGKFVDQIMLLFLQKTEGFSSGMGYMRS